MTDDFIIGERDQGEGEHASSSQRVDQERLIRATERSLVHHGDRRDVGRGHGDAEVNRGLPRGGLGVQAVRFH